MFPQHTTRPLPAPRFVIDREDEEARVAPRRTICLPALLRSPAQFEPIHCRVTDFSSTGARILVGPEHASATWHTPWLPGDLTLELPMDRAEVECLAVWKREGLIGLRFRSAMRHRCGRL